MTSQANQKADEVNFDGLVGPTHNYSGLSWGNEASSKNRKKVANPKAAALQGLAKMKALHDAGFKQAVLPPHHRPDIDLLKQLGFQGTTEQILKKAAADTSGFLAISASASCMWTANAATVSPSADTVDKKVHFTPANLNAKLHRAIEPLTTSKILKAIFNDETCFLHHNALPSVSQLGDEGAANHSRFCAAHGLPGVELFVYGRKGFDEIGAAVNPQKYPARQTKEASQAITRLHGLQNKKVVFAKQHPDVIDAGVFHNDVIAVANQNVFFYHEAAFIDTSAVIEEIQQKMGATPLIDIKVLTTEISVEEVVESYLFNSQLLTREAGNMTLVVPQECQNMAKVSQYLNHLLEADNPIDEVKVFDLHQSMANGGGPACLRLRVVLTDAEMRAMSGNVMMSDTLYPQLVRWVNDHYRDRLGYDDLVDIRLLQESQTALQELTDILQLGSLYEFQR